MPPIYVITRSREKNLYSTFIFQTLTHRSPESSVSSVGFCLLFRTSLLSSYLSLGECMIRKFVYFIALTLVVTSIYGCNKNIRQTDEGDFPGTEGDSAINTGDENVMGDSDSGRAMGLQTVHFPYDSFKLDDGSKSILSANANILQETPSLRVQIEGHCDSRGGIQYNIALGEKRAKAVKDYLLKTHNISSDRVTTISYGKERLLDPSNDESAHSRNRRGNFVITSK